MLTERAHVSTYWPGCWPTRHPAATPTQKEQHSGNQHVATTSILCVFVSREPHAEVRRAGFMLKKCSRPLNGVLKQFVAIRKRTGILACKGHLAVAETRVNPPLSSWHH